MLAQAEHTTTARGFGLINFKDAHGDECSLQISSACGSEEQPLGYLWLGVNDANPQIMKSKALEHGLQLPPGEVSGWMPFPIPKDVSLSTRMHLGEAQVRMLMAAFEQWLETRTISPAR